MMATASYSNGGVVTAYPMSNIFDNWPVSAEGGGQIRMEEDKTVGLTEVRRIRLQMVLAVNPLGIPSLAFGDAYTKIFGRQLDIQSLGFDHLGHMVSSLTDVFTIQEPDDITALMFPDFPQDYILHDARLGRDFERPNLDIPIEGAKIDPNILISHAWLNRDDEFPPDVVLAGEQYSELILPMALANIPGTHGLHQVVIVGAAHPNRFHINIKGDSFDRIDRLSADVFAYFRETRTPVEAYSVPKEFIYQGFPCLVYQAKQKLWERVEIVGRSAHKKQTRIVVKTVDYGEEFMVDPIYLYLMPRKFLDIPKQGIAVSMLGLKPQSDDGKWEATAGRRLRCFSNRRYWLDCLLVERNKSSVNLKGSSEENKAIMGGIESLSLEDGRRQISKRSKDRKQIDYEVILCDRNEPDFNVNIDEILVFETYAVNEENRLEELNNLKEKMVKAMETVTRPINPLEQPSQVAS